jgi:hypothetical protein
MSKEARFFLSRQSFWPFGLRSSGGTAHESDSQCVMVASVFVENRKNTAICLYFGCRRNRLNRDLFDSL